MSIDVPHSEIKEHEFIRGDVLQSLAGLEGRKYNLIISSPPYNIGKVYERDTKRTLDEYEAWQTEVLRGLDKVLADDGSICWQVGNFVKNNEYVPLDIMFYRLFADLGYRLRNRIIWRFNFGFNADLRFSGRYETLLWFTKSERYTFNLDPVRIPQLYPGKRHVSKKGEAKAGKPSGNPLGKNPSDYWEFSAQRDFVDNPVWDIPNVKAGHPEKTAHPCQFPIELAERCILAFTNENDAVLDPFVGTGASMIAAHKHKRFATGIDRDEMFLAIAQQRLSDLERGVLPMRPSGKPVARPNPKDRVAQIPAEWLPKAG